jgi:hypothetical protein
MNQLYSQYGLLFLFVLSYFINVYYVIEGRPRKDAGGFPEFATLTVITALSMWLYIAAGAFSELF